MKYETLLDEAYEEGLIVKKKPLHYSDGRIKGNKVAIRKNIESVQYKQPKAGTSCSRLGL